MFKDLKNLILNNSTLVESLCINTYTHSDLNSFCSYTVMSVFKYIFIWQKRPFIPFSTHTCHRSGSIPWSEDYRDDRTERGTE